jgi:hypothetical protein
MKHSGSRNKKNQNGLMNHWICLKNSWLKRKSYS